ncbi:MAG: HD domain-containing protein [Acidobacteriota bacterium]
MGVVRINEPISSWGDGDFVQGYALMSRKDVRQDRNGRDYIDIEMTDSSGSVPGKIWPDSPAIKGHYSEKDFVAFKGTVRLYREQVQLNIDYCRGVNDADREKGFDPGLLIPTTPEDIDDLVRRLAALIPGAIGRPSLRRLAEEAQKRFGEGLREHPAAKSIHHAYRGGLLEHVVKMAEVGVSLCEHYPEIDRDLILLSIYFHDLGKLREIGPMPTNDYTLEGQLVGHIVIGLEMLRECCDAVDQSAASDDEKIPQNLRLHLEHLVVSHHGRREYGSPIEPSTPEAFVLHLIDNLDSKLNQLRGFRRAGVEGLYYVKALGRSIYFEPKERPAESGDGS